MVLNNPHFIEEVFTAMTIISNLITPYFLMGYGALIITVVSIYQYYEHLKVRFIFKQPDHLLALQYVTDSPKLIEKMLKKYESKLSERHNLIISLKKIN